ncbi:uncharacterized protein CCR75_006825 [Bremia lactucae]|uniref:tRNA(Ile)-lysidine synthetase n=1 Tax=Bremia lactucae TaxID=4779 RepID=A0A976FEA2_BRELC|nr:hypothetical protein CCR75_006825 [Bremia lactucae]
MLLGCGLKVRNHARCSSIAHIRCLLSTKIDTLSLSADKFAEMLRNCGVSKNRLHHDLYPLQQGINAPKDEFPMAVALSGGADSMALMLLLREYLQYNRIETPLLAVTVDHQLRLGSSKEALEVANICAQRGGIRHITKVCEWHSESKKQKIDEKQQYNMSRPVKPRSSKMEEQARQYRYSLLRQVCQTYRVRCLFVAHTRGDQLETTLFRLGRASGINGLAGIVKVHPFFSFDSMPVHSINTSNAQSMATLIRPLLSVTKKELMATCARFHQTWIQDPSNDDLVFDRVRIRQALKRVENEHGPEILDLIARFQLSAEKAKHEFERIERAMLSKYIVIWELNRVVIRIAVIHDPGMFLELLYRIVSIIVVHVGSKVTPPRLASIQRLARDLECLAKGKQLTLGGCRIKRIAKGCHLEFLPEQGHEFQDRN